MNGDRIRSAYRVLSALALFSVIPIFVLGAGFAGGFGSALNSFRSGLNSGSPLNWFFLLPLILLPLYWWLGRSGTTAKTSLPWKVIIGLACLFGGAMLFGSVRDTPVAELPSACHRGTYRLADGRIMAVTVSPVAALNVRLSDGSRAMTWTGDHLAFSGVSCFGTGRLDDDFALEAASCLANTLKVDTHDGPPQTAQRIPVEETPADFSVDGQNFRARLFSPPGNAPVPIVVLPANRNGVSNLDWGHEQYLLSGLGIAVFVYDKPEEWPFGHSSIGSDQEAVKYARAALNRARGVMGERASKVGFYGGVDALLAGSRTKVDFVAADATEAPRTLLQAIRSPVLLLTPGAERGEAAAKVVQAARQLSRQDRHVTVLVFPQADQHMMRYESRGGERCQAGEPKSYYPSMAEWIANGRIERSPDMLLFSPER